jgi:hypothetical protein
MFCENCGAKTEPVQPAYTSAAEPVPPHPDPPHPVYTPPSQTAPSRQQAYALPHPPAYSGQPGGEPLRIGQYIGMLLLMCVPILNVILLFVWGFGGSVNLNKKNFARASLILCAVMLIFWIVAGGLIMGALDSIMGGYY